MDYSKAEATIKNIEEAIEICEKLIAELTEDILQTSVGTITTLQEKIVNLKSTLEAAKSDIKSLVENMMNTESTVKSGG